MAVDQVDQRGTAVGSHHPDHNPCGAPWRDIQPVAQGENRVKHSAGIPCQSCRVANSARQYLCVVAAQCGCPVAVILQRCGDFAVNNGELCRPYFGFLRAAPTTPGNQRAIFGQKFCLDEHVRKRGMGGFRGGRGQCQLDIGTNLDFAGFAPRIGNRQAADFGIGFA